MSVILPFYSVYGHFFGGIVKTVGDYEVTFVPYPSTPIAGSNSTLLNFSILKENNNVNNVHVAITIAEKATGKTISQFPYKLYEFSDVTLPYTFSNATEYAVTLQARIAGDEDFQESPLTASFDISVTDPNQWIPFDQLMLFYVTPPAVIAASATAYLYLRHNRKTTGSESDEGKQR